MGIYVDFVKMLQRRLSSIHTRKKNHKSYDSIEQNLLRFAEMGDMFRYHMLFSLIRCLMYSRTALCCSYQHQHAVFLHKPFVNVIWEHKTNLWNHTFMSCSDKCSGIAKTMLKRQARYHNARRLKLSTQRVTKKLQCRLMKGSHYYWLVQSKWQDHPSSLFLIHIMYCLWWNWERITWRTYQSIIRADWQKLRKVC